MTPTTICLKHRVFAVCALAALPWLTPTPARAQTPAPGKPPAQPEATLPMGARLAFVNLQIVFSESEVGKQSQARWRALNEKLFAGLSARDKEIQGLSEKIKTQQTVVEQAVLATWNQNLARLEREAQFAQQEAQIQSDQLKEQVLAEFSKQVQPVIDALRIEKGLHAIVAVQSEPGGMRLVSAEPGMDISAELVKRLNAKK